MEPNYKAKCIEKGCDQGFFLTPKAVGFFKEKGFPLPKRCFDCRQARRLAKEVKSFEEDMKNV